MPEKLDAQVWPVGRATKPACGAQGHMHPREDWASCVLAVQGAAPTLTAPSGVTPLGKGLVDAWMNTSQADHESFHRIMCEVPFTSLRDLDKAREIEGMANEFAQRYGG